MVIDTHCHLTHPRLAPEVETVIRRAEAAGVLACLTIGTGVEDARLALDIAARFPGRIWCSAGIDPFTAHAEGEGFGDALAELKELLAGSGFRALGEIGLDYHHDLDPRPIQAERFERQLEVALGRDLAVVVHVREAHDDMIAILADHPANRGVIHSFSGSATVAERYLDLGWHLGFNGLITFKSAEDVLAAAGLTPGDRLLVETDSPYLAPAPLRGKRCEPAYLVHTLKRLAEVRGETVEHLASSTSRNALDLFGLSLPLERTQG